MNKISIITSLYNKNDSLRNTLTGLMKQKISVPYEICIVDDGSDVNPESIVRECIPDNILKFKRFEKNIGPVKATTEAYKMASKESDILVTMSGDVIILDTDGIEKLCMGVDEGVFTIGEIKTLEINFNMYDNWNSEVKRLKGIFDDLDTYNHVYCGSLKPNRWFIFLGGFRRGDAERSKIFESWDVNYRGNLRKLKYKPVFPMVKAIHQMHDTILYKGHGQI